MFKKVTIIILSFLLLCVAAGAEIKLWVTADIHGNVVSRNGGLAKIFTLLEEKRDAGDLLIDAGDLFQGSYSANSSCGMNTVNAFNLMGYDFYVPGNHEFEFGADVLRSACVKLKTQILCANWRFVEPLPNMKNYAVIERDNVRIGIIGVGERESRTRILPTKSIIFTSEEKAIAEALTALRKEKVDIMILVRHGGIYFSGGTLYSLLKLFPEIDIVIGGHSHQLERGRKIAGAYYIQPGAYGEGIGEVCIAFNESAGRIERITSKYHEVGDLPPSQKMSKILTAERKVFRQSNIKFRKRLPDSLKSVYDVQKYLVLHSLDKICKADVDLFFADTTGLKYVNTLNEYLLYRLFPYENPTVLLKVSLREYRTILAECEKYAKKYKISLIKREHIGNKKYITLRTSSFILSGGGRNFPECRRIAEKKVLKELPSLRSAAGRFMKTE